MRVTKQKNNFWISDQEKVIMKLPGQGKFKLEKAMKIFEMFILLMVLMIITSCSNTASSGQQLPKNEEPNTNDAKQKNYVVNVPVNIKNAKPDGFIYKESSLLFMLPDDKTLLGKKGILAKDDLNRQITRFAKTNPRFTAFSNVYLKSDVKVEYGKIIDIYKILQNKDIAEISFVVSPTENVDDPTHVLKLPISSKDDLAEQKSWWEIISLEKNGDITLNSAAVESLDEIAVKLQKMFEGRPGGKTRSNQAVLIKAPRSAQFGEVIKLIDAALSGGAFPVILQTNDLAQ